MVKSGDVISYRGIKMKIVHIVQSLAVCKWLERDGSKITLFKKIFKINDLDQKIL